MNYFFFLDHPDSSLESTLDLFNKPPSKTWSKQKLYDAHVNIFYSNGKKWIFDSLGILKKNKYITIKKSDLPENFRDKSVFVSLNKSKYYDQEYIVNENYMNSIPAWRSNIRIFGQNSSCSYQGEIPGNMIQKNLSLVSCSPMIQLNKDFQTYFYLINLNKSPEKIKFKIDILNIKKEILYTHDFYTNTINIIDLNKIPLKLNDEMYIFISKDRGGIPIYFSKNKDNTSLSIEHTHPPTEYTVHGNRQHFQKVKKSYWFN